MSEKLNEFKELISKKHKISIPIQTIWVTVKDVDWEDKTMTAIGQDNELDYFNILLGIGSLSKKPKIGSLAIIGSINNSEEMFMLDCAEFEEAIFCSGDTAFTIKSDGYIIKTGSGSLRNVLNDLISNIVALNKQVQAIVVLSGTSPNVPALLLIEQQSNTIKQALNNILIE